MVTNNRQEFSFEYRGLSTDVKPLSATTNALYLELDTGDFYYFTGAEWLKLGGE